MVSAIGRLWRPQELRLLGGSKPLGAMEKYRIYSSIFGLLAFFSSQLPGSNEVSRFSLQWTPTVLFRLALKAMKTTDLNLRNLSIGKLGLLQVVFHSISVTGTEAHSADYLPLLPVIWDRTQDLVLLYNCAISSSS